MSNHNKKPITIQELTSKAGKASVAGLTKEQRKVRATKASHARKYYKDLPQITHSGEIIIGDKKISCAVVSDGRRVISQSSVYEILGRTKPNSRMAQKSKKDLLPDFIGSNSLKPFIPKELTVGACLVKCQKKTGGLFNGYEASLLPDICEIYLKARDAGALNVQQQHIAMQCDIVIRALSKVGLVALIDESSGYQKERERDALQNILRKYIQEEFRPWTKRFPDVFFDLYKKMYGIKTKALCPSHIGHFINRIYKEMGPGILDELRKVNPIDCNGKRKSTHHQHFTENIGVKLLDRKILQTITLMRVADNKDDFSKLACKLTKQELDDIDSLTF